MKESETEERKLIRAFGTKDSLKPFPLEYCSQQATSQERKNPIRSIVLFSFAEARGSACEKRRKKRVVVSTHICLNLMIPML